ncbi:30S ribosomal protein S8 [Patescibacteria group bacterium]|nr:30S ribosomal protein S8 [Patescibacteria group bacterium]MBU3923069.1 30S ribosomal protein S8 [Patescibacteria group bacterium]
MFMVDPISDMLTRIRNAQAVDHKTVSFSFSKIKYALVEILEKQGFLAGVTKKGRGIKREIEVSLGKNKLNLKRISKPGQRIYASNKELNKLSKERGLIILSTSQGLMTLGEAKRKNIGGEVLCKIY